VCDELNIPYDSKEAHSAAYDSAVTAEVFCSVVNKYQI
jgi:ribonuclease T